MLLCLSFALRNIYVAVPVASGDTGNTCAGVSDNAVIATICGGVTVSLYPQKHETTLHSSFFPFSLNTSLSFAGNLGRLTWVRQSRYKSSTTQLPSPISVCNTFMWPKDGMTPSVLGFLTCAQMLMHAIAHRGLYGLHKRVCAGS